ncbi:hypothetical protein ABK040_002324 [Willaertia magna]
MPSQSTTFILAIALFTLLIMITDIYSQDNFVPDKCPVEAPDFVQLKCEELFEKFQNVVYVKTTSLTNENGWCCFQKEVKYIEHDNDKKSYCVVQFHPNLRIAPVALWSTTEKLTC